ncbi:hypothetical protein JDV02_005581 [Purpureocillium takamizusanense]|uniref:Ketoreductase (KR) domain-containing protein n=1 Tax=Purpureocillium takamizusanense TaxID=2060973 RepID=A0A9Q8QIC5_9HYPO|nr:uncharacterized protein JDV02_005581 [Purpureocillium takamizusanense]UNI19396.1 hypothetical protein JDV02_005581 [Purpureocillium takamizusanense]
MRSLLPRDLARFVVASPEDPEAERIAEVLPVNCRVEHLTAFQGKPLYAAMSPYRSATERAQGMLGDTLRRALKHAQEDLKTSVNVAVNTVSSSDLVAAAQLRTGNIEAGSALRGALAVLDWQASPIVQARVSRLDTKPVFKADRTYWLVGLSGSLGLSICDWMIAKGAKYIVITSRSPHVEAAGRRVAGRRAQS